MLQSPPGEEAGDQLANAEVQIAVENHMVSRRQRLKNGQARRHARAEANCLHTSLKIGQALFKRFAIGVVNPAVEEMPGESSIGIAFKSGGGVDRRSDRARGRVHMPPGMDTLGLKLLVQIRLRCHTQSLLRSTA